MTDLPQQLYNPCSLDDNEQVPAKVWELLRRNSAFQAAVERLAELDAKERANRKKNGKYHGFAWEKSYQLVQDIKTRHPFAGIALQWLVPEPLFHCHIVTWPLGKKWKEKMCFSIRFLREGEGTTPKTDDPSWVWRNSAKPDVGGHPMRRGPLVYWTTSRYKRLRDKVNSILEWRRYPWPFTVGRSWKDAPPQFRREFQFIWRRQFDCRPKNPISNDRSDSSAPYEVSFFNDWSLDDFRASGQMTHEDASNVIRFNRLANDYRVFAIPKTILTKASADTMGQWLADHLKRGSSLYGDLLKGKLLNEAELLGTTNEWTDWLAHQAGNLAGVHKDTHFYRRSRYMNSLVDLVYPRFEIGKLLAPPTHRARGKQYVRKS